MLCTDGVAQRVGAAFKFQMITVAKPMAFFGEVPDAVPPGLVYNVGSFRAQDGKTIPIRFLHFELARVVLDIAADSNYLDEAFSQLKAALTGLEAADGSPVLGPHEGTSDYSEVSCHLNFPVTRLLPGETNDALSAVVRDGQVLVPAMVFSVQEPGPYDPPQFASDQFTVQLRAGVDIAEQVYFTNGPVRSSEIKALLAKLERALSPQAEAGAKSQSSGQRVKATAKRASTTAPRIKPAKRPTRPKR
jgi:hypothetical protein